jgi:hypothetical protein
MEEALRRLDRQPFPNLPAFPGGGAWGVPGRLDRSARQQPRLGAQVARPTAVLVDQLDLPKDQGQVMEEVGPNSPAAKAGVRKNDVLLELDGKPVPSDHEQFIKLLDGIPAGKAVDAVVMRKGRKETVKGLTLPAVKAAAANPPALPNLPGIGGLVPNLGRRSITTSRVNDQFTTTQRDGNLTITVKGKISQGKAEVSEVTIEDGGQTKTYDSVSKVPAAHQEAVKKLIEMSGGRRVRLGF